MKIFRNLNMILKDSKIFISCLNILGFFRHLSDEKALKLLWYSRYKKKLSLGNPRGFNEKLQWLKLYDRNPQYTIMADKLNVRNLIKDRIGEDYLIPLLGVWDNPSDINFETLPNRFVLKCTHNSGLGMYVCQDKKNIDVSKLRKVLRKGLAQKYYYLAREWVYKDIVPRIIAEQFMEDNDPLNPSGTLINYKFYCFNGEPKFLYIGTDDISSGTKGELRCSYLDLNWQETAFTRPDHKTLAFKIEKPFCIEEMVAISRKLSKDIPFVRVDLYLINKKIYFSELTFYPGAGYGIFYPEDWEIIIGDWLVLPNTQTSRNT